jgi:hypothetical protein
MKHFEIVAVGLLGALTACSWSMSSSGLLGSHSSESSSSGPAASGTSGNLASGTSGGPAASGPVSGPEIWKKWAVRGIELSMPRSQLVKQGFTCGKRANSRCYKLMDKRCETGLCQFKEDAFGQWFELNGAKTQLDFMTCATTETDSALIYDIRLYFSPRQLLTLDSTLGKAMIGKYGQPSSHDEPSTGDPNGGGRMIWWNPEIGNNGPEIIADCNNANNAPGGQCQLEVEDYGLVAMERAKQEQIDKQRMLHSQPKSAPEL